MSKNLKTLIAVGGTGGHVIPGLSLASHLAEKNFKIKITTDKRGYNYIKGFENYDISILPSFPIKNKNIFLIIFSYILVFYSIIRALFFLIFNRPKIIFGMGGYASFPICIAAKVLRIKFVIYENNLIIGKANKFLLPFTNKILVSYKDVEGISKLYQNKVIEIGNIIKKEIIDYSINDLKKDTKKLYILILGGSQAAKIFAEKLPVILKKCNDNGVSLKIYQQCLPSQNEKLKLFYDQANIDCEIFYFSNSLINYFSKANLAITRSGSSMLAELTNANIPFISIPLPSSADNHQFKNASFYKKKISSLLVEEIDIDTKLYDLIKDIHENPSIISSIVENQRLFSDKNVYNNINQVLKDIVNEKN